MKSFYFISLKLLMACCMVHGGEEAIYERWLAIGDSITQHGPKPELNWYGELRGMAASDIESDYVHVLLALMRQDDPHAIGELKIVGRLGKLSGGTIEQVNGVLEGMRAWNPNQVTIQLGENDRIANIGAEGFAQRYTQLLDAFTTLPEPPLIICTGVWAPGAALDPEDVTRYAVGTEARRKDDIITALCQERGLRFVPVAPFATDRQNSGDGESSGVRWHPNDAGMQAYAEAIYKALPQEQVFSSSAPASDADALESDIFGEQGSLPPQWMYERYDRYRPDQVREPLESEFSLMYGQWNDITLKTPEGNAVSEIWKMENGEDIALSTTLPGAVGFECQLLPYVTRFRPALAESMDNHQVIWERTGGLDNGQTAFELPDLSPGVYRLMIKVSGDDGQTLGERLCWVGVPYPDDSEIVNAISSPVPDPVMDPDIHFDQWWYLDAHPRDYTRPDLAEIGYTGDPTTDFNKLREMGYDAVRIYANWDDLEPIPGYYDFNRLDRIVRLAGEAGLRVKIITSMEKNRAPYWLWNEEMVDQNGERPNSADHRFANTYSLWGGKVNQAYAELWRNLVRHYRGNLNVTTWEVMIRHYEWVYPDTKTGEQYFDYSSFAREGFIQYLRDEKGYSLQEVSERSGQTVEDWQDVTLPHPKVGQVDTRPIWQDFVDFNIWSIQERMRELFTVIREEDPYRAIVSLGGGGWGPYSSYMDLLKEYGAYGQMCSFDTEFGHLAANEYTRAEVNLVTEPWNIFSRRNVSRYWFNMLAYGATRGAIRTIPAYGRLTDGLVTLPLFMQYGASLKEYMPTQPSKAHMAVLFSYDSQFMGGSTFDPNRWDRSQFRPINNAIDSQPYEVDWVTDYNLVEGLGQYDVIIDPGSAVLRREVVEQLLDYVRHGGFLILSADSGLHLAGEDGEAGLLRDESGLEAILQGQSISLPKTVEFSEVIHLDTLGSDEFNPMVREYAMGKGSVLVLENRTYSENDWEALLRYIGRRFSSTEPLLEVDSKTVWHRSVKAATGETLYLICSNEQNKSQEMAITFRIPKECNADKYAIVDAISEETVATLGEGQTEVEWSLVLEPNELRILVLKSLFEQGGV